MKTAVVQKPKLAIDSSQLNKTMNMLRALNHPLRLKILQYIHQHEKIIVSKIYAKLQIEQSVTSQHLAILRKHGFVNAYREGRFIFYSVNYERLQDAHLCTEVILKR